MATPKKKRHKPIPLAERVDRFEQRLHMHQPLDAQQVAQLITPVRVSLQLLLDGTAGHDDLIKVASAVNLAWQCCLAIKDGGQIGAKLLEDAGAWCHRIEARGVADGLWKAEAGAVPPLLESVDLYEQLLGQCSRRQFQIAYTALMAAVQEEGVTA